MQWINITVQQIKIAIFRHKCWIHDLSLAVWNQIAKQLAMTKITAFVNQNYKSCTVAFCWQDTEILRLWNWYCLPSLVLSYNPELLKLRDPDTACNETYLFFTPIRGVGYYSLTTWTKSAKYWMNHNSSVLSGYKWCKHRSSRYQGNEKTAVKRMEEESHSLLSGQFLLREAASGWDTTPSS